MKQTSQWSLLFILAILLVSSPTVSIATLLSPTQPPAYAPGQILMGLHPDLSPMQTAALVGVAGIRSAKAIAENLYVLPVAEGQEEVAVERLQSDPRVAYASLNYVMREAPLTTPLEPAIAELPSRLPDNLLPSLTPNLSVVVTGTLHMSSTPDGPPLGECMPSGSSMVYAVFDYQDMRAEPVRIQVLAMDLDTAPSIIYDTAVTLSGGGTASVEVMASSHFGESSTFPPGGYLTLLQTMASEGGGWVPRDTASWCVLTRPTDPYYLAPAEYQWNLHNTGKRYGSKPDADIDAPEAWDVTTGSDEFVIAILSTGVALDHPDLKDKIWVNGDEVPGNGVDDDGNGYVDDLHGYEFWGDQDNPDPSDDFGWGTFAAGITAAGTNNEIGMAGVAWGARIMPLKVTRPYRWPDGRLQPAGYLADLIQAIDYAWQNGAQVIFIAPVVWTKDIDKLEALRQAIERAVDAGALVVAPVGDNGQELCLFPACFKDVVGVGATDFRDEMASFSNFGPAVSLVAPSKDILSTCSPGLPVRCRGEYGIDPTGQTAWAAAHVAGAATLVWSVNPELAPWKVRGILEGTADDLGAPGPDDRYGYGRLSAGQAVHNTDHLPKLEKDSLIFLVDDQANRPICQRIKNPFTGPFTMDPNPDVPWLRAITFGPYTPSYVEVCVERSALPDHGTYFGTVTISSTIDESASPIVIPVKVIYVSRLPRAFLPLVARSSVGP